MRSGRIELYNRWDDRLIGGYEYESMAKRNRMINIWKSRYKNKFQQCYLQIIPTVDDGRIKDNGENQYVGRSRTYKQIEKIFLKTT